MRLTTQSGGSHQLVLSKPQRQICLRHIDLMTMVSSAARQTIDLCQELFAERRWNCSSITSAPRFMPDLTGGTVPASYYPRGVISWSRWISWSLGKGALFKSSLCYLYCKLSALLRPCLLSLLVFVFWFSATADADRDSIPVMSQLLSKYVIPDVVPTHRPYWCCI